VNSPKSGIGVGKVEVTEAVGEGSAGDDVGEFGGEKRSGTEGSVPVSHDGGDDGLKKDQKGRG